MRVDRVLEELWETTPPARELFDPRRVADLPDAARRYIRHAVSPGAKLASAAHARMHGHIRLKGEWHPFEAEQVLRWDRGFVWKATVKMNGLPVVGSDRWVNGEAAMRWNLLGLFPVARGGGPQIARSAAGRFNAESLFLPTALLDGGVRWLEGDPSHAGAVVKAHGEESRIELTIAQSGAVRECRVVRWGDPDGRGFRYVDFGGVIEEERCFGGLTVPSSLRLGWFYGTDRFTREGEFFRATVDEVEYR